MKTNTNNPISNNSTLAQNCLASCRKFIAKIERIKDNLVAEFRDALGVHERLLRLALNEAEALAWQTDYPLLVFPALATEKAHEVAQWHARQDFIDRKRSLAALAA